MSYSEWSVIFLALSAASLLIGGLIVFIGCWIAGDFDK